MTPRRACATKCSGSPTDFNMSWASFRESRFVGRSIIAVPEIVGDHLLQVFGEGLSNVGRHAHASKIEAVVAVEGEWLSFSLVDDGVGVSEGPSAGNGIRNMSTRAENLGGTFTITRREPTGTIVEWRVPLLARPDGLNSECILDTSNAPAVLADRGRVGLSWLTNFDWLNLRWAGVTLHRCCGSRERDAGHDLLGA